MSDEIIDAIEEAAKSPARVTIDGQTAESHPIPDLIAADRHVAAKTASARNHFGLRFAKLEMPGAG